MRNNFKIFAITLFFVSTFTFLINGCSNIYSIEGSGNSVTLNRKINNFSGLNISGGLSIHISSTQPDSILTIICDDNFPNHIKTFFEGDVLIIDYEDDLSPVIPIKIILPDFRLQSLDASGAIKFTYDTSIVYDSKSFSIDVSGANTISLPLNVSNIEIDVSGANKISLNGFTNSLHIEASGANTINAENLESNSVFVDASGANSFKLNVTEEMELDLSGANSVKYRGNPKRFKQDVSGNTKISKLE